MNNRHLHHAMGHDRERRWREHASYKLNTFWGGANQTEIGDALRSAATIDEAVAAILNSELYTHHAPDDVVEHSIAWHMEQYPRLGVDIEAMPAGVTELASFPNSQRRAIGGRLVSPDLFRHIYVAQLGLKMVEGRSRPRILELGSGTGAVAAMTRALGSNATYVLCDIPESLVFARLALTTRFPDARMLWVNGRHELDPQVLDQFDFVFMPTMLAEHAAASAFDLFMNFHSMGEFDNSAIRFWMHWLQGGQGPANLLVCNRYLNFGLAGQHEWRLNENEASVGYDARWQPAIWELEPHHLACPYIRTVNSRYLLFAARNGGMPDAATRQLEARQSLAAARRTNILAVMAEGPPTSYRLGMLRHDLTMSGPLFHLWNAVRMSEDEETLSALISYLDALFPPGARHIEERSYYVERLRRLRPTIGPDSPPPAPQPSHPAERRRPVRLLASHAGYNILALGGATIAVQQSLGPIDFDVERIGDRELAPFILIAPADGPSAADPVAALIERIDALTPA